MMLVVNSVVIFKLLLGNLHAFRYLLVLGRGGQHAGWSRAWRLGIMGAKQPRDDARGHGKDRAKVGVPRAAMAGGLVVAQSIPLMGESESNKGGRQQIGIGRIAHRAGRTMWGEDSPSTHLGAGGIKIPGQGIEPQRMRRGWFLH